ncbi:MAG: NUMOD3 domain-containing DNA-binding protein [Nanoarchaeota archaeon]
MKGYHYSLITEFKKGIKYSEEQRENFRKMYTGIANPFYGKKHTEESKINMRNSAIGRTFSAETREKLSISKKGENNPFFGMAHTKESIEKRNRQRMENGWFKNPEEHKKKIRENARINPNFGTKGKKMPLEVNIKNSARRQNISIHEWKGFKETLNSRIRKSLEFRQWRVNIFQRDNYTCQECYAKSGNGHTVILRAHHIKKFSKYPELRFDIYNGITLCTQCHDKTIGKEEQFEIQFSTKIKEISISNQI